MKQNYSLKTGRCSMQEQIKTLLEQLDKKNPNWKEQLRSEDKDSVMDEETRNQVAKLIMAFRQLFKEKDTDDIELLSSYFDDESLIERIYAEVKQTLIYYNSFSVLREIEQTDQDLVTHFIEDVFHYCLLRVDLQVFKKYSDYGDSRIDNVVWAFDNLTDYYIRRLFTQDTVQNDFQNETGLSKTNSDFYADLYEKNFSELRLNTILNMLQNNQERIKQLERILIED